MCSSERLCAQAIPPPRRADQKGRDSIHGLRFAREARAALHPWRHAAAPLGPRDRDVGCRMWDVGEGPLSLAPPLALDSSPVGAGGAGPSYAARRARLVRVAG